MFQSVRPNSQIYILHRGDNPRAEVGYAVNQPSARPKYQLPVALGQQQEFVVDIVVKTNEQTYNFNNLPAQQDVSDSLSNGESLIISDSRDAFNSELINLKQKSLDIANSRDYHLSMADKYDKILIEVNPEFAEKQEQLKKIDALENRLAALTKNMDAVLETNKALMEQLKNKELQK